MKVKGILAEDFIQYKQPSMFISTCFCDWKCCREAGLDESVCQNSPLAQAESMEIDNEKIYEMFVSNPITKAVVIGGLEPMIQINEVIELIDFFRKNGEDCPFIVYTGYCPQEIPKEILRLKEYKNIVVKYGRYQPGQEGHVDPVLGIKLANKEQYAEVIS